MVTSQSSSSSLQALHFIINPVQAWFDSVGLGGNVRYDFFEGTANFQDVFNAVITDPLSLNTWKNVLDPPLPPGLAIIPPICRLLALAMVLPIFVIGLLDFAGYAVFRTLGLRKRRVRIKAGRSGTSRSSSIKRRAFSNTAPLLSPGTYDADTLLKHRARSASGASLEADELWRRTGGSFARVKSSGGAVGQQGASTAAGLEADTSNDASAAATGDYSTGASDDQLEVLRNGEDDDSEEDPHDHFARVHDVGVDGPLGFTDTDAESDAGDSPTHSRRTSYDQGSRRGTKFGKLQFTPMNEDPPHLGGGGGNDPTHAAWLANEDGSHLQPQAAMAADLEP